MGSMRALTCLLYSSQIATIRPPVMVRVGALMQEDFDYSASISHMEMREALPFIDPENLSAQDVLEVLLHLFRQKPGFVDRGHERNNRETAWVNAYLFRLKPVRDADGMEAFIVETVGSSVDRMAQLR